MIQLRKISFVKFFPSLLLSILFFLITITLFYFYTRGFIPHDEGWILSPAERITQGDIPFRDFHFIYFPGVAYVIAFVFKLFGVSIIVSRYVTMLVALLTVVILYKISQIISKYHYSYILPVLIYISWGPTQINFAWPVIYAILSGLLTCLLLFVSQQKKKIYLYFLAGITTGATLLFKQNFGVALLLNTVIFFTFDKSSRKKEYFLSYIVGTLFFPLALCIYFYFTNALVPFYNDMNYFMLQEIIFRGHQVTPFIYPDVWYRQILKTVFYLLPVLVSLAASVLAYKKNKKILFLASFTGMYYLIGIRPTTDIVHLEPLLSLIGLPLVMILTTTKNSSIKILCFVLFLCMFCLGMYTAVFRDYYRWDTPLIKQTYYTNNPRLGVLTDQGYHITISQIDDYIEKHHQPNNFMFIDSFSPSFYLLTNKVNPTKFIFFPPQLLSLEDQKEIIHDLTVKKVPLIMADSVIFTDHTLFSRFIINYYYLYK